MSKKFLYTTIALFAFAGLNAQNVGIDETSPGSKFSVKGNLSIGPDYSSKQAPTNGAIIEGQIGIGTNSPDSNSVLDIESSNKGIFIPRLTHTQRLAINNATKGLIVFDTDSNTLYFHNGIEWFSLVATDNINTVVGCYHWPIGPTGPTGSNGTNGTNGVTGVTGATGSAGTNGTNGSNGATGATGASGTAGTNGSNGTNGTAGATGPTGSAGTNGTNGSNGATGATGPTGTAGTNGTNGTAGATGAGYLATSTSSITIGSGSKIVTTQSGLAYLANDRVRISNTATTYMDGVVTSYSGTSLVVSVDYTSGSGTYSSWNIGIAGNEGATGTAGVNGIDGTNGSNGAAGATGATGPGYSATSATSNTIGTGSKTFTTQSGLAYLANDEIIVSNSTTAYMIGTVSSYSGSSLVINSTNTLGSGTYTSWNIGLTGTPGLTGATGSAGTNGSAGATGATGPTGTAGTNGTNGSAGATGTAGTNGAAGATGATGYLSSGSAAGNTPYWNGSAWIINSSNIYNNGANVGVGNTSPTSLLSVGSSSQFQVNSSGAVAAATGITSSGNVTLSSLSGTGIRGVYSDPNGVLINDPNLPASASPSAPITDNGCGTNTATSSTITLSGLTTSLSATNISVTVNITHSNVSQLRLDLVSPTGAILNLVNTGQTGVNLTNTVFSDVGSTTFPTSGTAPYTGTFKPTGSLSSICTITPTVSSFNGMGTINPNGTWTLRVYDASAGTTGTLNSWSINISNLYGTDNYLPKWTSSGLSSTSNVFDNGTDVGIGNATPSYNLDVTGTGRYTGALTIGTYTLPNTDGTNGYVLSTNGSGTVSWSPVASATIGSSYALTASISDPTGGSGTWTELGEITVPVNTGDVILTNVFFSGTLATTSATGITIRVTRSQTSGSGTVGTAVCYSSSGEKATPWWVSLNAINRETGLTGGTWYYKFWVATSSYSGTPDYQCIISKAQ